MNKSLCTWLTGVIIVLLAFPAEAQVPEWDGPHFRIEANTALTVPFEPTYRAEIGHLGFSIGGGGSMLIREHLELGLRANYTRMGTASGPVAFNRVNLRRWTDGEVQVPPTANLPGVQISIDGGTFSSVSLEADLAYRLITDIPVTPYFVIGPSIHRSSFEAVRFDVSGEVLFNGEPVPVEEIPEIPNSAEVEGRDEIGFGMRLGVGADIDLGGVILKVEPSYTVHFTEGENIHFMPIRIGTAYQF